MKYDNTQVQAIIKEKFNFLVREYNLQLVYDRFSDWGYKSIYKGDKTAVSVIFEFREAYVNVLLHRLVNGEIENDSYPFKKDTPLNNIGLDFIVKYKAPMRLTKPLYDASSDYYGKDSAFELMVNSLADNLKSIAGDVLRGNFEVFGEIDSFVKTTIA
jgi:hypothetical protein